MPAFCDATIDLNGAVAGRVVKVTGIPNSPDLQLEVTVVAGNWLGIKVYRCDEVARIGKLELALPRVSP